MAHPSLTRQLGIPHNVRKSDEGKRKEQRSEVSGGSSAKAWTFKIDKIN